jgi:dipeptidyl aminopeptidase/acylaminoacyl peptidase
MDADGGNPRQLSRGGGEVSPAFSPDGKWVVYQSRVSGRDHLYRVPVDGGEPVQLTETTSYLPSVSPDGKYIACGYWDEQLNSRVSVALIPFDGGQPVKLFPIQPGLLRWSPLAGGEPKQVTNFKADRIFSFDWSRDRRLACSRGIVTSDVVVISNLR